MCLAKEKNLWERNQFKIRQIGDHKSGSTPQTTSLKELSLSSLSVMTMSIAEKKIPCSIKRILLGFNRFPRQQVWLSKTRQVTLYFKLTNPFKRETISRIWERVNNWLRSIQPIIEQVFWSHLSYTVPQNKSQCSSQIKIELRQAENRLSKQYRSLTWPRTINNYSYNISD